MCLSPKRKRHCLKSPVKSWVLVLLCGPFKTFCVALWLWSICVIYLLIFLSLSLILQYIWLHSLCSPSWTLTFDFTVLYIHAAGCVSVGGCHLREERGKGARRMRWGVSCAPGREAISQLVCSLGSQAENAADLWSKLKWCQCRNKAPCWITR